MKRFLGLLTIALLCLLQDSSRSQSIRDRNGVPLWDVGQEFSKDVFTFARVRYSSYGRGGWGGRSWNTDWPDADLNFSYRLQQMTSLRVHPEGKIVQLTDKELFDYPFIYMVEPGSLHFSEPEVKQLALYLKRGGFLMVDDFWGEREWDNFYREIKRVFPDREPIELPLEPSDFPLRLRPEGEAADSKHRPGRALPRHRHHLGTGGCQRGALPRHFRRQGPDDGDDLPQHRPRRWLGTGR